MATHLIGKSALFAIEKHGDQKYGIKPYHVHLCDVAQVLRRFFDWEELPQDFIDAAWLHDVIEDTQTQRWEVESQFGKRVADLVNAVSDELGLPNRKERHVVTYAKIRDTENAITIKLADRIANLEQCVSHDRFGRPPSKRFSMYAKEWDDFQESLRGKCKGEGPTEKLMWEYIDEIMAEGLRKSEKLKSIKTFRGEI